MFVSIRLVDFSCFFTIFLINVIKQVFAPVVVSVFSTVPPFLWFPCSFFPCLGFLDLFHNLLFLASFDYKINLTSSSFHSLLAWHILYSVLFFFTAQGFWFWALLTLLLFIQSLHTQTRGWVFAWQHLLLLEGISLFLILSFYSNLVFFVFIVCFCDVEPGGGDSFGAFQQQICTQFSWGNTRWC